MKYGATTNPSTLETYNLNTRLTLPHFTALTLTHTMNNESLNDKAVSALALMNDVKSALDGINDYGDATGFREDHDQLVDDFHAVLGMMRARASRLIQRAKRHKRQIEQAKQH